MQNAHSGIPVVLVVSRTCFDEAFPFGILDHVFADAVLHTLAWLVRLHLFTTTAIHICVNAMLSSHVLLGAIVAAKGN